MSSIRRMQQAAAGVGGGFEGAGELWGWGRNAGATYQLGTTSNPITSPIQIGSDAYYTAIGLKSDATLWSWGSGYRGASSQGDTTDRSCPVQIGSLDNWGGPLDHYENSSDIGSHGFAINQDGKLYCLGGDNEKGNFGLGHTSNNVSTPTQVGALTDWAQVAVKELGTSALKTDGTAWSWGIAEYGVLGDGTQNNKSSPVQVSGGATNWTWINCGQYAVYVINTLGELWCWGANLYGQLGIGNTTVYSTPVQVGSLTNWAKVWGGGIHALGLKTDGTLWSWGHNYYGQLGLGNQGGGTNRSSPVQIGSATDWIHAGTTRQNDSFGIRSGGTLWSWGANNTYQGGRVNNSVANSPVQVSGTGYTKIFGGAEDGNYAIK